MPPVHYLLAPDRSAARALRRALAESGARIGVLAGTWTDLVERALAAFLLPGSAGEWPRRLRAALAEVRGAFWSESLEVAPEETAQAVGAVLRELLGALEPAARPRLAGAGELGGRLRVRVADLDRLLSALAGALPPDLEAIRALLAAPGGGALQRFTVYRPAGAPPLDRWQQALLAKLDADAGADRDPALAACQQAVLDPAARAAPATLLGRLQRALFEPGDAPLAPDGTVQWLGVRDHREEAEVAAGMAQRLLDADPALGPADLGLLVPLEPRYLDALADAFALAGLPLSGLPLPRTARDLGREAVLQFLLCRNRPAPAMAIAACLTSPLMPWPRETGAALAQSVMAGDYRLAPLEGMDRGARRMLGLLRGGSDSAPDLAAALEAFGERLAAPPGLEGHLERARAAIAALGEVLAEMEPLAWPILHAAVRPERLAAEDETTPVREGVSVLREDHEPWRAVRHLIVAGFAAGRYPLAPPHSPVLFPEDLEALRARLRIPLETPAQVLARRRALLARQLRAAADSVSFLVPRRDAAGAPAAPSESLVFMHRHVAGIADAEALVLDLDASEERARARHVALAAAEAPVPPRALEARDPELGRDLLAVGACQPGGLHGESPSSLETLMVSPLAWLLQRLGAEPAPWAPEALDALLRGALAHEVFERLFPAGGALPAAETLPERVRRLLDEVARERAPFLRTAHWQLERRHLGGEIARAARHWREALEALGARVAAAELRLAAELDGVPLRGRADAVLDLGDGELLVVDYKKAGSRRRLERMRRGFDSQVTLYRRMLAAAGPESALGGAREIGVLYYMMNDQVLIADAALDRGARVRGWQAVTGDVSREAMPRIGARLAELRSGRLRLNREGDAEFFEREAQLTPYALERSPLLRRFVRPAEEDQ